MIINDEENEKSPYEINDIKEKNDSSANFCTPKMLDTPKKINLHQMSMQKSENQ